MRRKSFSIILLLFIAMPVFAFAAEIPDTIDEAVEESREVGGKIFDKLPDAVGNLWNENVLPVWKNMLEGTISFWEKNIVSKFKNIWQIIRGKVEEKKPELERELEKEKQEIKEDLQKGAAKAAKNLFERFLDLFRDEKPSDSTD